MKEAISLLLDEGLESQKQLLSECRAVYNLRNKGKNLRYWCRKSDLLKINIPSEIENKIIFYGSNDFHHLTYNLIGRIKRPTTLLLFDRHTECLKFFKKWIYCGSWVYDAIKLPNIEKVIIVGVDSDIQTLFLTDLLNPLIVPIFIDLNSLVNQVRIFPYIPHNKRLLGEKDQKKLSRIINPPVEDMNGLLPEILDAIKTDNVYISIDKDVLTKGYSVTNWGNGRMDLNSLIQFIDRLKNEKNIIAVDVCGDRSQDKPDGFFRKLYFYKAMIGKDSTKQQIINEKTNIMLLEHLKNL